MRTLIAAMAALVLAAAPGLAAAQDCPCGGGTRIQQPNTVATLLGNKWVCATAGGDRWQEFHTGNTAAGGALTDYKKGSGHPKDPTKVVGSWRVTGNGANTRAEYNYGPGHVYAYTVCQDGASVNFCGATNVLGATLNPAGVGAVTPCGPV